MDRRRKRSLLARIEGQVFALARPDRVATTRALQRIDWALKALRNLPLDDVESELCRQLERRVAALRDAATEGQPEKLFAHRSTLARTDCLLWQLRLRRTNAEGIVVDDDRRALR